MRGVPCLGRRQDVRRRGDMLFEQGGQLIAGGGAVVGLDGVADVVLVLQQPLQGGVRLRVAAEDAEDGQARPGNVVLPQLTHGEAQGRLLGGRGRREAVGELG